MTQPIIKQSASGSEKLQQDNLNSLSKRISAPAYDRHAMGAGILHISVGGFHRSHQAYYLDKLFSQNKDVKSWAVFGVSALPNDKNLYDHMAGQDYLYSLLTMSQDGIETKIIGSIIDGCFAPQEPDRVVDKIADAETKIVSLTITEWGYYFDSRGNLDMNHADVQHDLNNPDRPKTALFLIVKGLQKRSQTNKGKVTLLSCDNLQGNGHVLEKIVLQIADKIAPDLKTWIDGNVTFPSSMVDRITPVANPEDIDYLANKYAMDDRCPVRCEPFIQWVIEDNFASGRPPLEQVGVQFVHEVAPYEKMKIRLLNANHSALCYLGYLFGHRYVHEVALDKNMSVFMRHVMDELTPTLDPVPGIDVEKYKDTLIERFSNPKIADTLLRICNGGSEKFPKFFFDALKTLIEEKKAAPHYSALAMAGWLRFLQGVDEKGESIKIEDPAAQAIKACAQDKQNAARNIFDLNNSYKEMQKYPEFIRLVQMYLDKIYAVGAQKTVQELLQKQ